MGSSKEDIIGLKVAGVDCLESLEYFSERKVTCVTKAVGGIDEGYIQIKTITGGEGTSTVCFQFNAGQISFLPSSLVFLLSCSSSSSSFASDKPFFFFSFCFSRRDERFRSRGLGSQRPSLCLKKGTPRHDCNTSEGNER